MIFRFWPCITFSSAVFASAFHKCWCRSLQPKCFGLSSAVSSAMIAVVRVIILLITFRLEPSLSCLRCRGVMTRRVALPGLPNIITLGLQGPDDQAKSCALLRSRINHKMSGECRVFSCNLHWSCTNSILDSTLNMSRISMYWAQNERPLPAQRWAELYYVYSVHDAFWLFGFLVLAGWMRPWIRASV
jgi:hypothetical protein